MSNQIPIKNSNFAVIHIITKLDLGGAQKSCLALLNELQANYPNFTIYLISGTQGALVNATQKLKHVFLLDSLVWEVHPKNLLREIKNFYRIWQIIHQIKAQHNQIIVHTHTIKAGTIGRWAAWCAGVKNRVHTIHGFAFNLYQNKLVWLLFYLIELINSLITTHFVCVSSQDLKAGSEIFPFFRPKTSLIRAATLHPNHQKIAPINNLQSPCPKFIIGTIASLKCGKNLFELLKSFKYAYRINPNLQLQIIGDGPLRPALQDYLQAHHLSSAVQILGWQTDPDSFTQNWDLFAFTSLWEGLPCAVVEMLAQNIPVLAYQVGGIGDLIGPDRLIYPTNWLDLAQKIVILAQTKTKPASSQASKLNSYVPDSFYIDHMTKAHAALYQRLLS